VFDFLDKDKRAIWWRRNPDVTAIVTIVSVGGTHNDGLLLWWKILKLCKPDTALTFVSK